MDEKRSSEMLPCTSWILMAHINDVKRQKKKKKKFRRLFLFHRANFFFFQPSIENAFSQNLGKIRSFLYSTSWKTVHTKCGKIFKRNNGQLFSPVPRKCGHTNISNKWGIHDKSEYWRILHYRIHEESIHENLYNWRFCINIDAYKCGRKQLIWVNKSAQLRISKSHGGGSDPKIFINEDFHLPKSSKIYNYQQKIFKILDKKSVRNPRTLAEGDLNVCHWAREIARPLWEGGEIEKLKRLGACKDQRHSNLFDMWNEIYLFQPLQMWTI